MGQKPQNFNMVFRLSVADIPTRFVEMDTLDGLELK